MVKKREYSVSVKLRCKFMKKLKNKHAIPKFSIIYLRHRCVGYYFPRYATRVSQYETTQPTVGDQKSHIDSQWLGKKKKKYVQCILYGWRINFERMLQVL